MNRVASAAALQPQPPMNALLTQHYEDHRLRLDGMNRLGWPVKIVLKSELQQPSRQNHTEEKKPAPLLEII